MNLKTSRNFDLLSSTPTDEYWKKQREKAKEIFVWFRKKREWREDYLSDAKILKEALDEYEKIQDWARWNGFWDDFWILWAESFYFRLKSSLNSEDNEIRAKSNQADEFAVRMQNEIMFFELSLSKISPEKQSEFLSSQILQPYYHFLEKQFTASKYLLSTEWEKIVNLLSKTSYENRELMTEKFLSQYQYNIKIWTEEKKVTLEELYTYSTNKDPEIRKQAIQWINESHVAAKTMAENEMNSILEYKKTIDDLRWFKKAEESMSLRDDISLDTVQTMVDSVKDHYDFSRNFYKFKAKLFWVDIFTYGERCLSYWDLDKRYTFEEAVNIVKEVLWSRDSELLDIFNKSLDEWRIDVFPQRWKRWWAFCTDSSKWLPVYILLNYTNKLRDISTLIHESWHNACNSLQKKNLNALQYGCVISAAETPSTFYESLLADYIEKTLEDEELLVYRMSVLDDMVATVNRQVAEFRYEQELHAKFREKWYLSADEIWNIFVSHMKDYTWEWITYDEYDANRRIWRSHTRMFFYVYSYASGYLISQAMLSKLKKWTLTIEDVKKFFWSWWSKSPEWVFKDLWIDITSKEFRDEAMEYLNQYLQDTIVLAKKLWKL